MRHDRVAEAYDCNHPEINNPTEQGRLRKTIQDAVSYIATENRRALDFGAGTGNLTEKLLGHGLEVWASDVSQGMLDVLARREGSAAAGGRLHTQLLTGEFPLPFADAYFGLAATYSVLHHVPDYLAAVRELARVVAPGGVLLIDHELNADHWRSPFGVRLHRLLCMPGYAFQRVRARAAALIGRPEPVPPPPEQRDIHEEGDIHVYADDCIDWVEIRRLAASADFVELPFRDYLLCRETSRIPVRHLLCRSFARDTGIYVGLKRARPPA